MENGITRDTFESYDTNAKLLSLYDKLSAVDSKLSRDDKTCMQRRDECDTRFKRLEYRVYPVLIGAFLFGGFLTWGITKMLEALPTVGS